LSGDAGDELFGGYPWRIFNPERAMKQQLDPFAAYYQTWVRLIPDAEKPHFFTDRVSSTIDQEAPFGLFQKLINQSGVTGQTPEAWAQRSFYFELKTFLHGLLMVDDKLGMAHGLETRAPFLDNDLVDFALRLPLSMKIRSKNGQPEGKWLLREAMQGLIPESVLQRPKQGFSGPDASWFRSLDTSAVTRPLLDPNAGLYDYLQFDTVQKHLHSHQMGEQNNRLLIWSILSFEYWLKTFIDGSQTDSARMGSCQIAANNSSKRC